MDRTKIIEQSAKRSACIVEPGEHGSKRNAQRFGRLPTGSPFHENHYDRFANDGRKCIDRQLQGILRGQFFQRWTKRADRMIFRGPIEAGGLAMAKRIAEKMSVSKTQDLEQPGPRLLRMGLLGDRPPCFHKSFLYEIFGNLSFSRETISITVQIGRVNAHPLLITLPK